MNTLTRRAAVMAVAMAALGAGIPLAAPSRLLADTRGGVTLEQLIPTRFGDWVMQPNQAGGIVNPTLDAMLAQLYSETLTRTYINSQGYRIMLSMAYGRDQRGSLQLHYPEVCYPAQGFTVRSNVRDELRLDAQHPVPVRRLVTDLNRSRPEPVTYWTLIGNQTALGGLEKKRIEASYALKGYVPDGLLFRMSSVDNDSARSFAAQDNFARELLQALPESQRVRLAGQPANTPR